MSSAHTVRVTATLTQAMQDRLQAAADLCGATLDQFLLHAAIEKADAVIDSDRVISLTREGAAQVLDLIDNPPPPTPELMTLMEAYMRGRQGGEHRSIEWTPRSTSI
jgi:uncharacterized protein (DUF1778 family)